MVQTPAVDIKVPLDLDESPRPKTFLLARKEQRQDRSEGFVRTRLGRGLVTDRIAPKFDLGMQQGSALARFVCMERGSRAEAQPALLGANSILKDPRFFTTCAQPECQPRNGIVEVKHVDLAGRQRQRGNLAGTELWHGRRGLSVRRINLLVREIGKQLGNIEEQARASCCEITDRDANNVFR